MCVLSEADVLLRLLPGLGCCMLACSTWQMSYTWQRFVYSCSARLCFEALVVCTETGGHVVFAFQQSLNTSERPQGPCIAAILLAPGFIRSTLLDLQVHTGKGRSRTHLLPYAVNSAATWSVYTCTALPFRSIAR